MAGTVAGVSQRRCLHLRVNLGSPAGVVKLVYTQDLGSCAARREGSSPFSRTVLEHCNWKRNPFHARAGKAPKRLRAHPARYETVHSDPRFDRIGSAVSEKDLATKPAVAAVGARMTPRT